MGDTPGAWTPVAGGTDLVVRVRDGLIGPTGILDLSAIEEMKSINVQGERLEIGALVTHDDLAESNAVQEHATALAQAAEMVGSPQIRNRGTVGGNVVNASPAADTVPPLFVLDAELGLVGPGGERWVPVAEFAKAPGETVLCPDELLARIRFGLRDGFMTRYARLGTRKALSVSKVGVAIGARIDSDGLLDKVRVALGSVAPTVIRAEKTESVLEGRRMTDEVLLEAAATVRKEARPITDIRSTDEYRREMCGVLQGRMLAGLLGG